MHELPKELANSLRSWRSSTYGNGRRNGTIDVEKVDSDSVHGGDHWDVEKSNEDYSDVIFERALNNSSLILVSCTCNLLQWYQEGICLMDSCTSSSIPRHLAMV